VSKAGDQHDHGFADLVALHALDALAPDDVVRLESHLLDCAACSEELQQLRAVAGLFPAGPADVLQAPARLWGELAARIGAGTDIPTAPAPDEASWHRPGPGIECQVVASDTEKKRVSMLVRLAPGAEYPPHRHAGVEELYLLAGELVIDGRTLVAGAYNRAEPGSSDRQVWSRTGCTCLLITSTRDELAT
jgi:anti-sigma factor RsiW